MMRKLKRNVPVFATRFPLAAARVTAALAVVCLLSAAAQTALTWQQVKDKFAAANPTLKAGEINIEEY